MQNKRGRGQSILLAFTLTVVIRRLTVVFVTKTVTAIESGRWCPSSSADKPLKSVASGGRVLVMASIAPVATRSRCKRS